MKRTELWRPADYNLAELDEDFCVYDSITIHSEKNGHTYTVQADGYLAGGGESAVYRAVDEEGGLYAVKFYRYTSVDPTVLAEHDKVCLFLEEAACAENHLLGIVAHGVTPIDTGVTVREYRYEVLPYIENPNSLGSMGKLTAKQIAEILPQMLQGIETLHNNGFLHLDVKPDNWIFLKQGRRAFVVLTDMGAALSIAVKDKAAFVRHKPQAITPAFAAPEIVGYQEACFGSDLYSLGLTILSMNGRTFDNELRIGLRTFHEAVNRLVRTGRVLDLPEKPSPLEYALNHLALGLLQEHPDDRFTLKHVAEFCEQKGEWSLPPLAQLNSGIRLWDDSVSPDLASLVEKLYSNWDKGLEFFSAGHLDIALANGGEMGKAMVVKQLLDRSESKEVKFAMVLHSLRPDLTIRFRRFEGTLVDLANDACSNPESFEMMKILLKEDYFGYKYRTLPEVDAKTQQHLTTVLEKLDEASAVIKKKRANDQLLSDIANWKCILAFSDNQRFRPTTTEGEWAALMKSILRSGEDAVENAARVCCDARALALLELYGLDTAPLIHCRSAKNVRAALIYKAFEDKCPEYAREAFIATGPYANICWIQEHIDLYRFQRKEHQEIKKLLLSQRFDPSTSVSTMMEVGTALTVAFDRFHNELDNNLLGRFIGLKPDEASIIPVNSDAHLDPHDRPYGLLNELKEEKRND